MHLGIEGSLQARPVELPVEAPPIGLAAGVDMGLDLFLAARNFFATPAGTMMGSRRSAMVGVENINKPTRGMRSIVMSRNDATRVQAQVNLNHPPTCPLVTAWTLAEGFAVSH